MQLGRYQILKQLAVGSIADVLLARATGLEGFARHVVIKRIRPDLASEDRFARAFLDEARIAGSLHHQNIVQVHDVGEQDGTYFFAMEYVHGEDVRKLLYRVNERNERIPLEHAIAIITATASGLHYAHEHVSPAGERLGLVHRDVTPANILIGFDGSVKLVDFGLAKAALRSTTTANGTLKGKASYMSPEQCTGQPLDRRTDIFALGVVLYELLTAQRLFKGANEFMTMAAIVEGQIPRPSSLRADVPPALDEIVLRALERAPDARYQTAEALRESLEAFSLARELRTSPKALSDYLVKLFGHRPEPWEAGARDEPAFDADATHGRGLVLPPTGNREQLVARHAARPSSPMIAAQTSTEEWADDDEHVPTVGNAAKRRPSEALATEPTATTPRSTDTDVTKTGRALSEGYATTPVAHVRSDAYATTPTAQVPPDSDPTSQTDRVPARVPAPAHTDRFRSDRFRPEPTGASQTDQLAVDDLDGGGTILEPPIFDAAIDAPRTTAPDDEDDAFEQEAATELAGDVRLPPRHRPGANHPPPAIVPRAEPLRLGARSLPGVAQAARRDAPPLSPPARGAVLPAPAPLPYPATATPAPAAPAGPPAVPAYPATAQAPHRVPSAVPAPLGGGYPPSLTPSSAPGMPGAPPPTLYGPTRVFLAKHGTAVAVVAALTFVGLFGLALRGCAETPARAAAPDTAGALDSGVPPIDAAPVEDAAVPTRPARNQPVRRPAASGAR